RLEVASEVVHVERAGLCDVEIEEASALHWASGNQGEIVGREEHERKDAQKRGERRMDGLVVLDFAGLGIIVHFEDLINAVFVEVRLEIKKVRAKMDEIGKRTGAKGAAGTDEVDCFQEVGFAL